MIKKRKLDNRSIRFEKNEVKKTSKFSYFLLDKEDIADDTKTLSWEHEVEEIEKTGEQQKVIIQKNEDISQEKEVTRKSLHQAVQEKNSSKPSWWKKPPLPIDTEKPTIKHTDTYKRGRNLFRIKSGIFLACCLLIWRARGWLFSFMKDMLWGIWTSIWEGAKAILSNTIGTKPQMDDNGNINVAILWYGGGVHDGGYLTDAIIIASVNLKAHTMSMLSLPRDMRVRKPNGAYGKLNSVFQDWFFSNEKDYEKAAPTILGKLTDITNIPLHYYAFIDFDWFEKFIDSLWGIEIDVPEPIYDNQYPWPNHSYTIFSIDSWVQMLDGATALKYTRSRKTTSDYSRSMRQQLVIDAVMDKFVSAKTLISPGKIEDAYNNITQLVHTNTTLDEILWLLPYAKSIDHKSSWQVAECWARRWEQAQAGCLLYTPPMETMGWMSTQIPVWATPGNPSNYSVIHSYVEDIVMNTKTLQEKATIRVLNWLSTGANKAIGNVTLANNIAVDFVKEWFIIFDIGNTTGGYTQTTVLTNGKGREASLEKIKRQLPPFTIQEWPIVPDGPSLTVILGDDMVVTWNKIYAWSKDIPAYLKY